MNTRQLVDEMNRDDYEPEPQYGDEVETWPTEEE